MATEGQGSSSGQPIKFLGEFGNLLAEFGDPGLARDLLLSLATPVEQFVEATVGHFLLGLVHSVDDHPDDEIDLSVGLDRIVRLGDSLEAGEPICRVHAANEAAAENVKDMITQAVVINDEPADISPVVIERIA